MFEPLVHEYMTKMDINLNLVRQNVNAAKKRRKQRKEDEVTIVGVAKTKPVEMIAEAYEFGQRHFGENYVNELIDKSNDPLFDGFNPDIKWHFLGHVQSNKVKKLVVSVPHLYMIESIDSEKIADLFNKAWEMMPGEALNVMIQVNTSKEASKSGVMPENAEILVQHIISNCHYLKLVGLMTIGSPNHDVASGPNPDYLCLVDLREKFNAKFKLDLKLSMGMSGDYEHAVELGSDYIRVGQQIFGPRTEASTSVS